MSKFTTGLSLLLLCFIGNTSAAFLPQNCICNKVTAPLLPGSLSLSLTGLYWQGLNTESNYALTAPAAVPQEAINGTYHNIDPNYDWGIKAEIAYQFACTANDLRLTFTNYSNNVSDRVFNDIIFPTDSFSPVLTSVGDISVSGFFTNFGTTAGPVFVIIPGAQLGIFSTPVNQTSVNATQAFKNNTWNLDVGKKINVGNHLQFRFFTGLQYSQLEHSLETVTIANGTSSVQLSDVVVEGVTADPSFGLFLQLFANPSFAFSANVTDIISQKSKYNGFGPEFGLDANLHLIGNLSLTSNITTSLLIGESKNFYLARREENSAAVLEDISLFVNFPSFPLIPFDITNISPTSFNSSTLQEFSFQSPNETRIVPNLDAKIGLKYGYCFSTNSSKVAIEGGYQISHYFNATDQFNVQHPGASNVQITHDSIDTTFKGPYIKLSITI